jgi:hypothetical protein
VDNPRDRGCVPAPDAVLLPGPDAEDRREEPTLFTKPAIGPPPPLLPPAHAQSQTGHRMSVTTRGGWARVTTLIG